MEWEVINQWDSMGPPPSLPLPLISRCQEGKWPISLSTLLPPPSSLYLPGLRLNERAFEREIREAKVRDLSHSQEQTKRKRKDTTRLREWVYEWRNALIIVEYETASWNRMKMSYLRFMHALISIGEVIIAMGKSIEERSSRWLKRSKIKEGREIKDHLGITGMGIGKEILCRRTFALVELKGHLDNESDDCSQFAQEISRN